MLKIERFANHELLGCPGRLYHNNKFICYTLEQAWQPINDSRGGAPFISCVPAGQYHLVDHDSPKWGHVRVLVNPLLDVYATKEDRIFDKQRYLCLAFHRGSYHFNFHGCIGAGRDYKLVKDGKREGMGITSTAATCDAVNDLVKGETILRISWAFPGGTINEGLNRIKGKT